MRAGRRAADPPLRCGTARRRALDLLARREHSRAELVRKLVRSGHERPEAERTVEALASQGLVSDARFAEAFIRSHVERGSGPLRIRRDLEARGIEAPAVERLLDPDGEAWESRARAARTKRFGEARPAGAREAARQARFLAGRGFTRRQVRRALEGCEPAEGEREWEQE